VTAGSPREIECTAKIIKKKKIFLLPYKIEAQNKFIFQKHNSAGINKNKSTRYNLKQII